MQMYHFSLLYEIMLTLMSTVSLFHILKKIVLRKKIDWKKRKLEKVLLSTLIFSFNTIVSCCFECNHLTGYNTQTHLESCH